MTGTPKDGYSFFELDGAYFRRKNNGVTRGVHDVLHGETWVPYEGKDFLKPALWGDEVPDPLAPNGPAAKA